MQAFTTVSGAAAPLMRDNIDNGHDVSGSSG